MILPNKLNIQLLGMFLRDNYAFFRYTLVIEFDKMQIRTARVVYAQSVYSLFGDNWNLRFCALMTVGALFILSNLKGKKK